MRYELTDHEWTAIKPMLPNKPRETVRRHMGRLVALGLFERAEDQTFVPTKELREVEIERALRLLRQGTAGLL